MYYFQMTGGGLPSDDGAMPYCTFGSGAANGNAVRPFTMPPAYGHDLPLPMLL